MSCISVSEAARRLKANQSLVYYAIWMGYVEAWKVRFVWRIYTPSVEEYDRRRNQRRNQTDTAGDTHDTGCSGVSLSVSDYCAQNDLGQSAPRIHRGRGMEHTPYRLNHVSVASRKFVVQYELFDEKVR